MTDRTMPEAAPLREGDPERLGAYEIIGLLGEGGQGSVFLGRRSDGEFAAVKLLHAARTADQAARARFVRELEVAKRVARFCTAQILDADVAGDRPYIVSEYVPGRSLHDVVRSDGPRRGGALERLAISTLTALTAIHRAGIVHRDFKPHNVMLGPDGPRVIDFGVARALGAAGETQNVGTPAYMAPEHFTAGPIGPATDMFAWGVTTAFAATGRPAFGNDEMGAVMHRILTGEPDLGDLPDPLRGVVLACLAKDPAQRPSAQEAQERLVSAALPADATAPGPGPAGPPPDGPPDNGLTQQPHPAWLLPPADLPAPPADAQAASPAYGRAAPALQERGVASAPGPAAPVREETVAPPGPVVGRAESSAAGAPAARRTLPLVVAAAAAVCALLVGGSLAVGAVRGDGGSGAPGEGLAAAEPGANPGEPGPGGAEPGAEAPGTAASPGTAATARPTAPAGSSAPPNGGGRPAAGTPTASPGTRPGTGTGTGGGGGTAERPNPYTAQQVCGSGYVVQRSSAFSGGRTYQLYSSATKKNCAVTLKTAQVGAKTNVWVKLEKQSGGSRVASDSGSFAYYAGPVYLQAAGVCVRYSGGTASGSTAAGWANCG